MDEYLLSLVQGELCAALTSIIGPLPARIDGLPGSVIRRLPAEVRNVVPREVLARATVRCEPTLFDASVGQLDPETKVLAFLAQAGLMATTLLQLGLGLMFTGVLLRHQADARRARFLAA